MQAEGKSINRAALNNLFLCLCLSGFEGFGGGMPGGGGRPQSDNTKFYKLLDVDKDASEQEVRMVGTHACMHGVM